MKLVLPGQNVKVDTPLGVDPVWYEKFALLFKSAAPLVEGDTGSVWISSFVPVVTPGSGAFTSVSSSLRYRLLGKTAIWNLRINITTNGTAGANVQASMPWTFGPTDQVAAGRATLVSGKMLQAAANAGANGVVIWNYDNTYPGANGERLVVNGVTEIA